MQCFDLTWLGPATTSRRLLFFSSVGFPAERQASLSISEFEAFFLAGPRAAIRRVDVVAPAALLLNVAANGTVEMSEAEVRSKLGRCALESCGHTSRS